MDQSDKKIYRVLLPISLGTGLSLLGDASMYIVLPTHLADAGVTIASVGILLSANRWIRLFLNGPIGVAYDRWPRRRLFIPALFIGAFSTALYGLTTGFWPLLIGRLLWGVAWSGIWVGGNSILLDMTTPANRGRWIGIYQVAFFLGASSGSFLGGFLTDGIGYHNAMLVNAGLTLLGALYALFFLPETQGTQAPLGSLAPLPSSPPDGERVGMNANTRQFFAAAALMGGNRLVYAGFIMATFSLYLVDKIGESVQIGTTTLGVASLTGILLGSSGLVSMVAAPLFGSLSDRLHDRWRVVAIGLLVGLVGFGLLIWASPQVAAFGILLTAVSSGSNQSLATTITGDVSDKKQHSRRLGFLFTIGDLMSAIGPPLAFVLIPLIGVLSVYQIAGAGFLGLFLMSRVVGRGKGQGAGGE